MKQLANCLSYHIELLVNRWLMIEGHSIVITDTIADNQTYETIEATIKKAKNEVHWAVERAHRDAFERSPGNSL